ncbi:class I SAM-dependent methyltransferase [Roseomonas sp. CAU 1739]|uniref:class I SAM-dependent methyltransferase n=1 Tax=Roseomonas sp. CAU 1739 TaxID=3140364 RepID=UPI00325A71D9
MALRDRLLRMVDRISPPPPPPPPTPPPPPPPPSWATLREADAAAAVAADPPDYKRYHQSIAASLVDLTGRSVLVVGCNRGEDCAHFVGLGARRVVGLDVMDEIGRNYTDPAVSYVKASAEAMPLDSGSVDLVFAFATLEHVPDIAAAFRDMARVAAPGGIVYSAAAPLWCARSGPHWGGAFDHDPWPHLRLDAEGVVALGRAAQAAGRTSEYYEADRLRHFMTDPLLFNRRRAHEYLDACAALDDVDILRNAIEMEEQAGYDPPLVRALLAKGYTSFDLFGLTHRLIARRR